MAGSSWTNQVQNQVIVTGSNGGVFVYSGTPALGNPPVAWLTNGGLLDPFGNVLPSVMGVAASGSFSAGNTFTTASGTVTYSGTPAVGNMVASQAPVAFTDTPGNAVLAGLTGYVTAGGVAHAIQSGGTGMTSVTAYYTAATQAGPWTLRGFIGADAAGMTVTSAGPLSLTTQGAGGSVAQNLSSGLSGGLPATSLSRTVLSAGNDALAHDITAAWTINAADGSNGAKYTIETHVTATTGPTTIQTLTLGIDLNSGTQVPLATLGTAFNGGALSTTYEIPVRLTVIPGAGSTGANAQIVLSAPLGDSSVNRLSTNSANMAGRSDTTAFNAANANTIALYAQWGGAGGAGQTAGTRWSEFTRSGQN